MSAPDDFNIKEWTAALVQSYCESIRITMRDFAEWMINEGIFDKEKLAAGVQAIEEKMLWSVKINIDKLESFYNESISIPDNQYDEFLRNVEKRSAGDNNYQERVDAVFHEIQQSCADFTDKKQKYLKFCLYDKYLDKEKEMITKQSDGDGGYFDVKLREQQIHAKAKQDKDFLRDFSNYVEVFANMQSEMLRKLQ